MNDNLLEVNIESFPGYGTTLIKIDPREVMDNSSFYEIELQRDELTLAKFLRKLKPLLDDETPIGSFRSFAKEALRTNLCCCYCTQENLSNIIELYRNRVVTPDKEFPGANEGDKSDVFGALYPGADEAFITESIEIKKDTWLSERLIKKGSTVHFYYKGSVE